MIGVLEGGARRTWAASLAGGPARSPLAAAWLLAVAATVVAMVVVGGATRLTGSGLSITQWKPFTGALPPLSPTAWLDLFDRYRQTPQYRIVNSGMTLAAFKSIFWWEWAHRLLGRVLGLVFAAPFVALVARRRIPPRLVGRCVGLFVLGGLQGLVGWWMVASGLEGRVSVAPERLAVHLALALALFCALVWTALDAWFAPPPAAEPTSGPWRAASLAFAAAVFLQCVLGALVAGNHAGLANADWPLMSGRAFPVDYWQGGLWATLVHGLAAVQFDHRLLAYGIALSAGVVATLAVRARGVSAPVRGACLLALLMVAVQIALGVAVLWRGVPTPLAMAHQLTATALLATAVVLAWLCRHDYGNQIPSHRSLIGND